MEIYSTEEQQEEAIKKLIKENWMVAVVGAAIGLAVVYGWRYYDQMVISGQEADSAAYTEVLDQVDKADADVVALANQYIKNHDNKSYTVMLAMTAAKAAIDKGNFEEAAKQLKWAADNAQEPSFKAINLIRLARVQVELKQYTEALASLSATMPKAFTAQVEELKGDIYLAQGEKDKARTAYQLAADNDGLTGNNGLQYKLDDLAQATPAL